MSHDGSSDAVVKAADVTFAGLANQQESHRLL
jgi:hypothetical protein